jgi:hypothetical protein
MRELYRDYMARRAISATCMTMRSGLDVTGCNNLILASSQMPLKRAGLRKLFAGRLGRERTAILHWKANASLRSRPGSFVWASRPIAPIRISCTLPLGDMLQDKMFREVCSSLR